MSSVPSDGRPEPKRRGLGRGLEVLVGGSTEPALTHLPLETIHPNPRQPRRTLDDETTAGLAESIRTQGLLQPVVVRPRDEGGYELIAGERRWRAAREAGVPAVPALIREADDRDSLLLALVENVAREQLAPADEARAYAVLVDEFGLSLGELAERVGRSKPAVSNRLRVLELPDDVLTMLDRGQLSESHARAILAVPDQSERRRLARRIVREGMSVRAAVRAARAAGARTRTRRRPAGPVDPALAERARTALAELTGRSIRVVPGQAEIPFTDVHDLAELTEALERVTEWLPYLPAPAPR